MRTLATNDSTLMQSRICNITLDAVYKVDKQLMEALIQAMSCLFVLKNVPKNIYCMAQFINNKAISYAFRRILAHVKSHGRVFSLHQYFPNGVTYSRKIWDFQ